MSGNQCFNISLKTATNKFFTTDYTHNYRYTLRIMLFDTDDEKKHHTLSLLSGYLRLLGPDVSHLVSSHSHLQRLGLALVQVLELDCSSVRIIQEKTPGEDERLVVFIKTKKNAKIQY